MLLIGLVAISYKLVYLLALNIVPVAWAFVKGIKETPLYLKE